MGHLITPCFNVHCMLKRSEGGLEKACMFNGFLCFRYLSFALLLPEAFGTSADVIFLMGVGQYLTTNTSSFVGCALQSGWMVSL